MFDLRLIRADVLKLRRRTGMLAISLLLTVGTMLLAFGVSAAQHASDPDRHGPAGGLGSFQGAASFLLVMTLVAGAIVGSTSGTQDPESGVFRDLAATGRSRLALYGARLAGALVILVPIALVATGTAALLATALAGDLPAPGGGDIADVALANVVAVTMSAAMAVGLSALAGARGTVIGVMLAFLLAVQPVVIGIPSLGVLRELMPSVAINRIGDLPLEDLQVGLAGAILTVVAWGGTALALGAWRTRTREI